MESQYRYECISQVVYGLSPQVVSKAASYPCNPRIDERSL